MSDFLIGDGRVFVGVTLVLGGLASLAGELSLDPYNLTPLNGTLYFTGADGFAEGGLGRVGLFGYNPANGKTTHLFSSADFNFWSQSLSDADLPPTMAAYENKLYFNCIPASSGQPGLYVWDPAKGTGVKPSLVSGSATANPVSLTVVDFN